jgi:dinuclear metal center YbgI/SA1388 family protein
MVKCREIIEKIEKLAPLNLAESWDNVGLLIGDYQKEIKNIMVTLDVTLEVVKEAVEKKIDLIIAHHPIIFKPLKKITMDDYTGQMVCNLIKNDISVYAAHTNLDIAKGGLNDVLASRLQLNNVKVLKALKNVQLKKIVVFIPDGYQDAVREAMAKEGAGWIGDYSHCTFMTKGTGTFKPLEGTNPFIGKQGQVEKAEEYRLETIVPQDKVGKVIKAMLEVHPYEEVAYDIYPLEIEGEAVGIGRIGTLENEMTFSEFIKLVKNTLNIEYIKYIGNEKSIISKVAICTGSGADFISACVKQKADVYITGDVKYHEAQFAQQNGLNLIDAGHYETENIVVPFLMDYLNDTYQNKGIKIFSAQSNQGIFRIV